MLCHLRPPKRLYPLLDDTSETTAPIVLKLHMQYEQTAGCQNDKIHKCRESKMAAFSKMKKKKKKNCVSLESVDK